MNQNKAPLAVIILTFNEEANLHSTFQSVVAWANQVFVVDSFSTDKTLEIAKNYTDKIYQNRFEGYPQQRNWALDNLPFPNEWVFFLDADERPSPELKDEINRILVNPPEEINGYYIKRKFFFNGKWIKHGGYYPTWLLRLFRHRLARCEERSINEHFIVKGNTANLQHDIIHQDKKGLSSWIDRHNKFATLEAIELLNKNNKRNLISPSFWGSQAERKRWTRKKIWNKLPPYTRPFIYFFYRYFLRLGFLDGKQGFIYHFLQGFWFPFLIDIKYEEIKNKVKGTSEFKP